MTVNTESPGSVNPHFLDHVVATSKTHEVETTEDIVSGNGIKLLAKGARVDAGVRDQLLQHKLLKPLEDCLQVVDGVLPAHFEPIAELLLDRYPLLRGLCASRRARPVPASLAGLTLSLPMKSLLTLNAQSPGDRLQHTVGVAMLALALGRKLLPGDIDRHRVLAVAGLVHDVGELYIEPKYLQRSTRLGAEQWRHIVTHPLVGHRVLREMAGAGPAVADAVLLHHERLDGFGYPRGIQGEAFSLDGQILAASEWLMAVVESEASPLMRAGMAARLVPGEFCPALLEMVSAASRETHDVPVELESAMPLEQAVPRSERIAATLQRFRASRAWIDERIARAPPGLRSVLETGLQRLLRIQSSFSSTGLDVRSPGLLLGELSALHDPGVYSEVLAMIGELEWRMRELQRTQELRASLLPEGDRAVIIDLIVRLRGSRTEAPAASPAVG